MESRETIIRALRCSSTVMTEEKQKTEWIKCPYRLLEEIKPLDGIEIELSSALEIDGKKYWESCDVDRISQEAADFIEQKTSKADLEKLIKEIHDEVAEAEYKKGREKTILEILTKINDIYHMDLHCKEDACERNQYGYDCEDCMYLSIRNSIMEMKAGNK